PEHFDRSFESWVLCARTRRRKRSNERTRKRERLRSKPSRGPRNVTPPAASSSVHHRGVPLEPRKIVIGSSVRMRSRHRPGASLLCINLVGPPYATAGPNVSHPPAN